MTPAVSLAQDDRAVSNLFVAYFYELAAWDPGIVMNDAGLPVWEGFGLPGPRTLDECARHNWWIRDRCLRHAIRLGDAAVGFAIVCEEPDVLPYSVPAGTDWVLLDFYVAPKARRAGVGLEAARQILERHHGRGLLFTLAENAAAQAFWRRALAGAVDVEESTGATQFAFRT